MKKPLLRMLGCESVAPFGNPVVPDVYWMLIASSKPSSASRPRSASGAASSPPASRSRHPSPAHLPIELGVRPAEPLVTRDECVAIAMRLRDTAPHLADRLAAERDVARPVRVCDHDVPLRRRKNGLAGGAAPRGSPSPRAAATT